MSQVVTWVITVGLMLLASSNSFGLLLEGGDTYFAASRDSAESHVERLRAGASITSAAITFGSTRCATFTVDTVVSNTGDVSVADFTDMDLVMAYTGDSGARVVSRLQYVGANLSDNQWTVSAISPDDFGVNHWDPTEAATIKSRVLPLPQPHSLGTVLVATPQGITDSAYVDFNYDGVNDCRYLHNNPTPPTGDTNLQSVLSMDDTVPTAATLYNYDQDVDPYQGRTVVRSAVGVGETDSTKYQAWRTGALADPLTLSGTLAVDLWSATRNFQLNQDGIATVYFRDYNGATYTEIAHGTIFDPDWQASSSSFVRKVVLVPGVSYTVPAGNELEVKLIVDKVGGVAQEMWFAYDTAAYQSLVNLSYQEPIFTTFYYLQNNPTPPTGDTNAQSPLPMDTTPPTATTLYNYDQDLNADPGRTLQKTTQGLSESLLRKHQVWRSGSLGSALPLVGDVRIDLWAAMQNFTQGDTGVVTVYLRDFDGLAHQEIAHGSVYASDWQDGSTTWVKRSIMFPELNYTVPAGNELEVFMVVESASTTEMWFAYDTTAYQAVLKIP